MIPSLYIHVPFCKQKCIYCNFYSSVYDGALASAFIDTIISQLKYLNHSVVHSIYIGGGTPSALPLELLEKLLVSLKGFSIKSGEFTVEANPESLDEEKMNLLLDLGVNRLSIGLQSLDDRKLKKLGRIHTCAKAKEAVNLAHKNGFKNISADLMFGVWGEELDPWKRELEEIVRLPITHVSCYELTYEKGTPLSLALSNKSLLPLDDEITSAMYETAIDTLALRGFKQYEISNFAKPGFESKHNMHYWENNPYMGLGPSAVSYINGVRSGNVSDVKEYIDRSGAGKPMIELSEKLSPIKSAKETAAVKIRTKGGIDFEWFRARTGFEFLKLEKKAVDELLVKDLIKYKREGERITGIALKRKGFLFCDTVSSTLI